MFAMFRQFFLMIEKLCSAGVKTATAVETLASIGEDMAATYADETKIQRRIKQHANARALAEAETGSPLAITA